jgi:hypothetical protein
MATQNQKSLATDLRVQIEELNETLMQIWEEDLMVEVDVDQLHIFGHRSPRLHVTGNIFEQL